MRVGVPFLFLLLAGCDQPEVKQCEDFILSKLRSPSTYKRIESSGIQVPYNNPDRYTVRVTYDAANAYGTPVREEQLCVFGLKDGKPDTSKHYDFDEDLEGKGYTSADVDRAAESALSAADNALKAADDAIKNASRSD